MHSCSIFSSFPYCFPPSPSHPLSLPADTPPSPCSLYTGLQEHLYPLLHCTTLFFHCLSGINFPHSSGQYLYTTTSKKSSPILPCMCACGNNQAFGFFVHWFEIIVHRLVPKPSHHPDFTAGKSSEWEGFNRSNLELRLSVPDVSHS